MQYDTHLTTVAGAAAGAAAVQCLLPLNAAASILFFKAAHRIHLPAQVAVLDNAAAYVDNAMPQKVRLCPHMPQ